MAFQTFSLMLLEEAFPKKKQKSSKYVFIRYMIIVENHTSFLQQVSRGCARRCNPLLQKFLQLRLNYFRDKVHINGGEVDLLIGNDYAPLSIGEKCVSSPTSPDDSPSVALTRLGCYIYGGLSNSTKRVINNILSVNHVKRIEDTDKLKTFFCGAVIGVKPTTLCVCSDNQIPESLYIKHVRTTNKINEKGRVCVQMPWKPGFPRKLPNNYYMAKEQIIRRERQLLRDGKLEEYNQEIKNLIDRGVVRILNPEEAKKSSRRIFQMFESPHGRTTR